MNIRTKLQLTVTLILVLFISVTGATYAYYAISDTNNNTITGDMATVNLTLDVTKVLPTSSINNTGVMVPQLSNSGNVDTPLNTALKSGCVDSNNNIVCQVYKINIQNIGGTATQVVDGSVSFYSDAALTTNVHDNMPNLKWKLVSSVNESNFANSELGSGVDLEANSSDNVFANDIVMPTGANFTYYMIVWINETNNDQIDKSTSSKINTFYAEVAFNSSNGTGVTAAFSNYSTPM